MANAFSLIEVHEYFNQRDKQKLTRSENIHRYHCEFAVIDEVHLTRIIDLGPFVVYD